MLCGGRAMTSQDRTAIVTKVSLPRRSLLLLLPILLTAGQPGFADDASAAPGVPPGDSSSASAQAPAANAQTPATKAPLQAGVQKVELNLERLREVGLDLKEV